MKTGTVFDQKKNYPQSKYLDIESWYITKMFIQVHFSILIAVQTSY